MTLTLPLDRFKAVIFDLDGVVTKTANLHAAAWKELFDSVLPDDQPRFDALHDYLQFVDGKPRYDGVFSFLQSRGIDLPWGTPEDSTEKETICAIGNRKNALFAAQLEQQGIDVYTSTVRLIEELRRRKVNTAVISSSKNCVPILQRAGLTHLFDEVIDGIRSEKEKIAGKPAPDIFFAASKLLGVKPAEVAVVEDARSGVIAGKKGDFGFVLGVNRSRQSEALYDAGAHLVVDDLSEIDLGNSAFSLAKEKKAAFFLDYDGTLTQIVDRPELATLKPAMRGVLSQLAKKHVVAIVSGRDREDVASMVGIEGLIYAGSHGFDISGPNGVRFEHEAGLLLLPDLDRAATELVDHIAQFAGAWVERKKFAIAVHFRLAAAADEAKIEKEVDKVVARYPRLTKGFGKKIFELKPQIDWNKGKALNWLKDLLEIDSKCIYVGDDVTDEDAFEVVRDSGIGICVQGSCRPTRARYLLTSVDDVQRLLKKWA